MLLLNQTSMGAFYMRYGQYFNKNKAPWSVWSVGGLALSVIAIAVVLVVAGLSKINHAAPNLSCSPNGFIFRDNGGHTDVQAIDMVTGQGTSVNQVTGKSLNAVGYNPIDNHFYAWDLANGQLVKLNSSLVPQATYTPAAVGYADPTNDIFSGDVDTDGYYWFFRIVSGTTHWYRVNLNTSTPTLVESGTTPNAAGTNGTDWAYMPGTDNLYRAMDSGGGVALVAFSRTSKTFTTLTPAVTGITTPADGDMGSVYADPDNNLYLSSHASGKLFRVSLDGPTYPAVELPAVDPSSNDGARCALASVPTDYGDAPSAYGTLITDDGPRHSIGNFDIFNSTAPLMLGKKVDIENNGFPSVDSAGDDADHEGIPGGGFVDDERGVAHIVATPGSSDPLVVPAYVTNTTSQVATLVGWIDLDNDSVFEVSERVTASVPAGFTGYQQLTFPAPATPYSVNTSARFRLFSSTDTSSAATGQLPSGPAATGEVEDVLVQVGTYDVTKSANPAEGSSVDSGTMVTYTLNIQNTGSTALTNLKIDDDLTDVLDDAVLQGAPSVSPSSAGSASVIGNTLEFVGDIGIGNTVAVTYTVKIKDSGTLGNAVLNNYVLAAHSTSCHPDVSGGSAVVDNPVCKTTHNVNGLANTGANMFTLLFLSGSLLTAACVLLFFRLR